MFVPCRFRPRSCLHIVVLYNKIGAGHITFLLLITNVCHTNNFSKTDVPSVRQDACNSRNQPVTEGWNITFPQRSSSCSADFQERNLPIRSPSAAPDSHFTSKIALLSFSKRNLLNKPRLLFATSSTIKPWSAALWKDSLICNLKNLRIHLLVFFHTMSVVVNQNIIIKNNCFYIDEIYLPNGIKIMFGLIKYLQLTTVRSLGFLEIILISCTGILFFKYLEFIP